MPNESFNPIRRIARVWLGQSLVAPYGLIFAFAEAWWLFMAHLLDCECGRPVTVTAGMAGTTRTCVCGRAVAVPSLGSRRGLPEVADVAVYELSAEKAFREILSGVFCGGLLLIWLGTCTGIGSVFLRLSLTIQVAIGGTVVLATALWVTLLTLDFRRYWDLKIEVSPEGLRRSTRDHSTFIRWDGIESVWNRGNYEHLGGHWYSTTVSYLVRPSNGSELVVPHVLGNVEDLWDRLEQESCKHLLPRLRMAYDEGKQVRFGVLALDQLGISVGSKLFAWDRISKICFDHRFVVVVHSAEQTVFLEASEIENLFVLIRLLCETGRIAQPRLQQGNYYCAD